MSEICHLRRTEKCHHFLYVIIPEESSFIVILIFKFLIFYTYDRIQFSLFYICFNNFVVRYDKWENSYEVIKIEPKELYSQIWFMH